MAGGMRGLSLVETLIGLLLMSIGLLAVAPLFVQAMRANATGAELGVAGAAAVARMERLRELPADDPRLLPGGSLTGNVSAAGIDYFDASDPEVVVRWRVADHGAVPGTRVVSVRAVALRPAAGRPKAATLTTLRGQ